MPKNDSRISSLMRGSTVYIKTEKNIDYSKNNQNFFISQFYFYWLYIEIYVNFEAILGYSSKIFKNFELRLLILEQYIFFRFYLYWLCYF